MQFTISSLCSFCHLQNQEVGLSAVNYAHVCAGQCASNVPLQKNSSSTVICENTNYPEHSQQSAVWRIS